MVQSASLARSAKLVVLMLCAVVGLSACGGKKVQRIDTNTTVDLSGRWNDTDSRLVSEEMIADVLSRPWLTRYEAVNTGQRPTVIVGLVRNRSSEHIPTETFTKDIERAFVNSGRVRVVASSSERDQLRDERRDQADYSRPETIKQMGMEYGADYMMMGTINSIVDEEGGEQIIYYQIDLELTDIESNEKVWIGNKEIKKYVGRGRFKA